MLKKRLLIGCMGVAMLSTGCGSNSVMDTALPANTSGADQLSQRLNGPAAAPLKRQVLRAKDAISITGQATIQQGTDLVKISLNIKEDPKSGVTYSHPVMGQVKASYLTPLSANPFITNELPSMVGRAVGARCGRSIYPEGEATYVYIFGAAIENGKSVGDFNIFMIDYDDPAVPTSISVQGYYSDTYGYPNDFFFFSGVVAEGEIKVVCPDMVTP